MFLTYTFHLLSFDSENKYELYMQSLAYLPDPSYTNYIFKSIYRDIILTTGALNFLLDLLPYRTSTCDVLRVC